MAADSKGSRPAPPAPPLWRQAFDVVEREVAPRLETAVRSEQFAVAAGLVAHLQHVAREQAARTTRRFWHLANLPAGTDVTRLLNEIGQLRRQVHELQRQLDTKEVPADAAPAQPRRARSPRSA